MKRHESKCSRLVVMTGVTILLMSGSLFTGMGEALAARSSKPKEIVVVGSKLEGEPFSLQLNATFWIAEDDATKSAGHFALRDDQTGAEFGGSLIEGRIELVGGTDCAYPQIAALLQDPANPGGRPVLLQLGLGIVPADATCGRHASANGKLTSVVHVGEFNFTLEIEGVQPMTGHAHGHLDYLKKVGDPATGVP